MTFVNLYDYELMLISEVSVLLLAVMRFPGAFRDLHICKYGCKTGILR